MGKYEGASRVALKPKTTEQTAALLRHCNERRLAVVPQASSCHGGIAVLLCWCGRVCLGGVKTPSTLPPLAVTLTGWQHWAGGRLSARV